MQRIPGLYFAPSKLGGRGIFTKEFIPEGSIIEICPVIVLPENERPIIHNTGLHDYYFLWGDDQNEAAIALGYGSLFNHAVHPNAEYIVDYEMITLEFMALRDIEAGEEITINYNGEPGNETKMWFEEEE